MPAPSIKSRPVYARLEPRAGLLHVMIADRDGSEAILDLADRAPAGFFDRAHILHVVQPRETDGQAGRLLALRPRAVELSPDLPAALTRLGQLLDTAFMGTRLYAAGTEGLIGQATTIALDAGMEADAIQAEHRGSEARRVQCAHCKGIIDDVTTQPCRCVHCGLMLFVRDHYSRRLAAFQGVCIDAEEPGIVPPVREAFP